MFYYNPVQSGILCLLIIIYNNHSVGDIIFDASLCVCLLFMSSKIIMIYTTKKLFGLLQSISPYLGSKICSQENIKKRYCYWMDTTSKSSSQMRRLSRFCKYHSPAQKNNADKFLGRTSVMLVIYILPYQKGEYVQ